MNKRIFMIVIAVMAITTNLIAGNTDIDIADFTAEPGSSNTVNIELKGTEDISGWQCAAYMPEGITISKVARGELLKVRDDNDEYVFSFQNSTREDGSRFLLCYTAADAVIKPEGVIAVLTINVAETVPDGEYNIELKDVETAIDGSPKSSYDSKTIKVTVSTASGVRTVTVSNAISAPVKVADANGITIITENHDYGMEGVIK